MNKPITVRFTEHEVVALGQLLDIALKAGGKNVVHAYMALDRKMQEAMTPKEEDEE